MARSRRYRRLAAAAAVNIRDLRRAPGNDDAPAAPAPAEPDEVPYRDLQARAKELDIPANQSREDLEAAIAKAGA